MGNWLEHLNYNPLPLLLSVDNKALLYFVLRDLTDEEVEPVTTLWNLPRCKIKLLKAKDKDSTYWSSLAICRVFKRLYK